eukprot:3634979-Prymnesium_polylepis.1
MSHTCEAAGRYVVSQSQGAPSDPGLRFAGHAGGEAAHLARRGAIGESDCALEIVQASFECDANGKASRSTMNLWHE